MTVAHTAVATAAVAALDWKLAGRPNVMGGAAATLVQASGLVALVWAYAGLILGLAAAARGPRQPNAGLRSGGAPAVPRPGGAAAVARPARAAAVARPGAAAAVRRPGPAARVWNRRPARSWRPALLTMHRQIDVMVLALTLLHALVYGLAEPGGSLLIALVPGTAPVQTLGFNLGVLALYLTAILGPSYYLRDRIGRRVWLVAHQLVAVSYAFSLWHALALGSSLRLDGTTRTLTWLFQIPLLMLVAVRLLRPRRASDQLRVSIRGGRYSGWRHSLLRTSMAWGLLITAVIVLFMALLAAGPGLTGSS